MNRFIWPLIAFIVLVALLAVGLNLKPNEIPSPFIGKPAPLFTLPILPAILPATAPKTSNTTAPVFSPKDKLGKVWLLNVWATWCPSCRQEHPMLVEMAKHHQLDIVGMNYKEVRGDAAIDTSKMSADAEQQLSIERANAWLTRYGNPYSLTVLDIDGRVAIDYGVYGAPETYVIDQSGVVRFKHIGAISADVFANKILPLVKQLEQTP